MVPCRKSAVESVPCVDADVCSVSMAGSRHCFALHDLCETWEQCGSLGACIKGNSFIIQTTIQCQVQPMCRKVGQMSLVPPRVQQNAGHRDIFVPNILPADTRYLSRQPAAWWVLFPVLSVLWQAQIWRAHLSSRYIKQLQNWIGKTGFLDWSNDVLICARECFMTLQLRSN